MTTKPMTVLAAVLRTHGAYCGCTGACGTEHASKLCGAQPSSTERPLLAAPKHPYASDHENAEVPVDELRPWCWNCWKNARDRERARIADQLRREMEAGQLDLFDVEQGAVA
ncbi:hypothetical protein [Streptomyces sp. CA2R101]|uniref:hypothetical protein n=1 Tax=Streptomyces sp. CA2R101 TaxID=3120152 RepID=UPI00300A7F45